MEIKLRKIFALSGALAALAGFGCVPAPADLCKSNIETECNKFHECAPAQIKALFAVALGTTAAECKTLQVAAKSCDAKTKQDDLCSGTPTLPKFHLDKAIECRDAIKGLSCDAYLAGFADPSQAPPSCALRCQAT